jgi:hypothetical protein
MEVMDTAVVMATTIILPVTVIIITMVMAGVIIIDQSTATIVGGEIAVK